MLRPVSWVLVAAFLSLTGCNQTQTASQCTVGAGARPAYPAWASSVLGKSYLKLYPNKSKCAGNLDPGATKYSGKPSGSTFAGWAWDLEHKRPVDRLLLTDYLGNIVGVGQGGFDRPDVPAYDPRVTSKSSGWHGVVSIVSGPVDALGITGKTTVCPIGDIIL